MTLSVSQVYAEPLETDCPSCTILNDSIQAVTLPITTILISLIILIIVVIALVVSSLIKTKQGNDFKAQDELFVEGLDDTVYGNQDLDQSELAFFGNPNVGMVYGGPGHLVDCEITNFNEDANDNNPPGKLILGIKNTGSCDLTVELLRAGVIQTTKTVKTSKKFTVKKSDNLNGYKIICGDCPNSNCQYIYEYGYK